MDFMPDVSENDLFDALSQRRKTALQASELLTGSLHNPLGRVLTQNAGISQQKLITELSDWELLEVCRAVKDFEVTLTEPMGMDSAQVTAGGILTAEFDNRTMESHIRPGLYACG